MLDLPGDTAYNCLNCVKQRFNDPKVAAIWFQLVPFSYLSLNSRRTALTHNSTDSNFSYFHYKTYLKFTDPLMRSVYRFLSTPRTYTFERCSSNKNRIAGLKILIDRRRRGVINKYNSCAPLMYTHTNY